MSLKATNSDAPSTFSQFLNQVDPHNSFGDSIWSYCWGEITNASSRSYWLRLCI